MYGHCLRQVVNMLLFTFRMFRVADTEPCFGNQACLSARRRPALDRVRLLWVSNVAKKENKDRVAPPKT